MGAWPRGQAPECCLPQCLAVLPAQGSAGALLPPAPRLVRCAPLGDRGGSDAGPARRRKPTAERGARGLLANSPACLHASPTRAPRPCACREDRDTTEWLKEALTTRLLAAGADVAVGARAARLAFTAVDKCEGSSSVVYVRGKVRASPEAANTAVPYAGPWVVTRPCVRCHHYPARHLRRPVRSTPLAPAG